MSRFLKKRVKRTLPNTILYMYEEYRKNRQVSKLINERKIGIKEYLDNNEVRKLQIGCGANILDGWLNTDRKVQNKSYFLDAGKPYPIPDESFHFIFSEHLFEHLEVKEQLRMLKESYRVLQNQGVLRIATPSLDFLIKLYANPKSKIHLDYVAWAMHHTIHLREMQEIIENRELDYCYVINNFFKAWGHKMIHNRESLKHIAKQVGFSNIRELEVNKSDFKELQNIEKHGAIIPENMNRLETMVLEMSK